MRDKIIVEAKRNSRSPRHNALERIGIPTLKRELISIRIPLSVLLTMNQVFYDGTLLVYALHRYWMNYFVPAAFLAVELVYLVETYSQCFQAGFVNIYSK